MKTKPRTNQPRKAKRPTRRPRNLASAFLLLGEAMRRERRYRVRLAARRRRSAK